MRKHKNTLIIAAAVFLERFRRCLHNALLFIHFFCLLQFTFAYIIIVRHDNAAEYPKLSRITEVGIWYETLLDYFHYLPSEYFSFLSATLECFDNGSANTIKYNFLLT